MTLKSGNSLSFYQRHTFWLLLISAIILRFIPIISIPFNWLESYFHELSHGFAALVTGGQIIRIQLFANGAGLCTTQGGSMFFTTFMGYTGAVLWGALLYFIASSHRRVAQGLSIALFIMLGLTILLWVRDLLTLLIVASLMIMLFFIIKQKQLGYLQTFMQFSGLLVILNGLFSPFYLLDGRHLGDGASLANQTYIPEFIWIALWGVFALATLYFLAKKQNKRSINIIN